MKHILLLGAGFVSKPLVDYLLSVPDFSMTVANRTLHKAEALVAGHPRGQAIQLDLINGNRSEEHTSELQSH